MDTKSKDKTIVKMLAFFYGACLAIQVYYSRKFMTKL